MFNVFISEALQFHGKLFAQNLKNNGVNIRTLSISNGTA